MEYKGDLYGKIGRKYFKLVQNTEYVDKLEEKLKQVEELIKKLKNLA